MIALATTNGCAPTDNAPLLNAGNTDSVRLAPTVREGMIDVPGGRVWYRMLGDGATGVPLLALHGGPGGLACRFERLAPLADERPIIFYDQLGSGRSDRPTDTTLWNLPRFVEELEAVRRALGLNRLHLLGHSWGGALAAEYMIARKPEGVVSLVLSSPLLSTPRWIADANALREALPPAIRETLDREEAAGTLGSPEYAAATDSFYARHVRRLPIEPEPLCEGLASNDTIYQQMWGPTEFRATGSLRTWSRADDLDELTLPVLLMAGEFDEARPGTLKSFRATMPNATLVVIPGAAHSTMREKPAEYVSALRDFLRSADSTNKQ
jgi:proline iminopeptidase